MPHEHKGELDFLKEWLLDYENISRVPAEDRQCHARTTLVNVLNTISDKAERIEFAETFLDRTMRSPDISPYARGDIDIVGHLRHLAATLTRKAAVDFLAKSLGKGCVEHLVAIALVGAKGGLEVQYALKDLTAVELPLVMPGSKSVQFWRQWWESHHKREEFYAHDWRRASPRLSRAFALIWPGQPPPDNTWTNHADAVLRFAIAQCPTTTSEALCILSRDGDSGVRIAIAQRTAIPLPAQRALCTDPVIAIRHWLASNPCVHSDILAVLAHDSEGSVRERAEKNADSRRDRNH